MSPLLRQHLNLTAGQHAFGARAALPRPPRTLSTQPSTRPLLSSRPATPYSVIPPPPSARRQDLRPSFRQNTDPTTCAVQTASFTSFNIASTSVMQPSSFSSIPGTDGFSISRDVVVPDVADLIGLSGDLASSAWSVEQADHACSPSSCLNQHLRCFL